MWITYTLPHQSSHARDNQARDQRKWNAHCVPREANTEIPLDWCQIAQAEKSGKSWKSFACPRRNTSFRQSIDSDRVLDSRLPGKKTTRRYSDCIAPGAEEYSCRYTPCRKSVNVDKVKLAKKKRSYRGAITLSCSAMFQNWLREVDNDGSRGRAEPVRHKARLNSLPQ
jgi:hypothetical protein